MKNFGNSVDLTTKAISVQQTQSLFFTKEGREAEEGPSWFLTFIQWSFKKRLLSIQYSGAGWAIHHSPSKHLPRDHTHPYVGHEPL